MKLYLDLDFGIFEYIWLSGLFAIFLVQIWFLLYWFALPKRAKILEEARVLPPVSLVICSRNQPEQLRALLDALLSQQYPEFEIIVADDRSDDPQYDMLLALAATHSGLLKVLHIDQTPEFANEKKYAQTLAIKAAKYEWMLFTDGDCLPSGPLWIASMAGYFQPNTQIVLGFGSYSRQKGCLNKVVQYETLLTAIQYFSAAAHGKAYMGVGRNLAYRKSMFINLKGHYQHLNKVGGDDDLFVGRASTKQNTAFAMENATFTVSEPKSDWKSWFYQKIRHSHVGKYYATKNKLLPGFYALTHGLLWAMAWISLFFGQPVLQIGISVIFVFSLVQGFVFWRWSARLNGAIDWWLWPFLSFCQCWYYLILVVPALFTKKVTWN